MKRIKTIALLVVGLLVIGTVIFLCFGCAEKIVSSRTPSAVTVQLAAPADLRGLLDSMRYRLIVTSSGAEILREPLHYNATMGIVESEGPFDIPGGLTCTFTIEAIDSVMTNDVRTDTTIMSGDTTIAIEAGQYYDLRISLQPTVALMLLTPTWLAKKVGDKFAVEVMLYNVPNVAGATLRIDYDSVLSIDSVRPTPNTNHDIFEAIPTTPHQKNLSMTIASSAFRGSPLFKSGMSGEIATIYFTAAKTPEASVTDVQLFPTSFYDINGPIFPPLLNDDPDFAGLFGCYVQINP